MNFLSTLDIRTARKSEHACRLEDRDGDLWPTAAHALRPVSARYGRRVTLSSVGASTKSCLAHVARSAKKSPGVPEPVKKDVSTSAGEKMRRLLLVLALLFTARSGLLWLSLP